MLAYAAKRPAIAGRKSSPNALLIVIGAHVAVIAAVMSAKMDLPRRILDRPPTVFWVPQPVPPPAAPQTRQNHRPATTPPIRSSTETPSLPNHDGISSEPATSDSGLTGPAVVVPNSNSPVATLGHSGPQLLTPAGELKPAYPPSKLLTEEEAVLTLRLTIDERGRVVAVDPIGRADPVFLDAARRHLIAHWRYKPAIENGSATASSVVITLHFQLDG